MTVIQNKMTRPQELADHNSKRANEWYKKTKQKQDAESVHDNRAQAQQKRRAAEKEKKATQSAQHLEALKQCDPNNPIHSQPLADKNIRQFDKEKSHLMVNICPLCKRGRITKMALKHQKNNYFSETQCTTCAALHKKNNEKIQNGEAGEDISKFWEQNDLHPSPIPPALQNLSWAEHMLIARAVA